MAKTGLIRLFFALSCILVFFHSVQASMIVFEKLDKVVGRSHFIAEGKIAANAEKSFQQEIEYSFDIELTRLIFGQGKAAKIKAKYLFIRPGIRTLIDKNGEKNEEWISPYESGSGLEDQARAGQKYIFLFADAAPVEGAYQLLRIEPLKMRNEVIRLIETPRNVAFAATVNSVKPLAGSIPKEARIVAADPRWLLDLRVRSVNGDQEMLEENSDALFAIHSPVKMFMDDAEKIVSNTYAFELTRTRKVPAATLCRLQAFPWLAAHEDIRIYDARIVDWGTYETKKGDKVGVDTIATKEAYVIKGWKLLRRTERIIARKRVSFGFSYLLKGFQGKEPPRVTVRVLHPPITHPRTGQVQTESSWEDIAHIGESSNHTGWFFEHDYEMVSGKWVIQLFFKEKKLLEKKFLVKSR